MLALSRRGGGNTNAYLILSIFAFYGGVFVILGLIGQDGISSTAITTTTETPSTLGFLGQLGFFFQGLAFTISALPAWANILLFGSLSVTLFYIFLSFLRGSS